MKAPTDLISRQAAIDALWGIQRELQMIDASEGADITVHGVQLALHKIEQLPSAQPEIIRCKDCVYFTHEKSGEHWNICRFYDAPKTADGFCNDAEPKVTENDKTD